MRHLLSASIVSTGCAVLLPLLPLAAFADSFELKSADPHELPSVPAGYTVAVFAKEPLVRNPAAMAFDTQGRLFVCMGPQWRNPTPETPGDEVRILLDSNDDGVADTTKTFASGFNCVQALAWRGRDLWVANAPDLTVVRDRDGDDVADEYVRVFTDLGNLEHSLHGLSFGPDGKLYMSKGNSKGVGLEKALPNEPDRIAPQAFRELRGVPGPKGAPDFPPPKTFRAGEYKRTYQDPRDDWGATGGILRCDEGGANLEIIARGFRNPWDLAFDSHFDFLGTDNDQNEGDRIFMPFRGAHFGWGHPWSAHWTGENHLPTAPVSGPTIQGSYAGIVHYGASQFAEADRGAWFVADWLRKALYIYRPEWRGALNVPAGGRYEEFARGGNGLFRPTDIEVGPDGALWILGWGKEYSSVLKNGAMQNEGRVFRLWHKDTPLLNRARSSKPHAQWSMGELIGDLGSWLPAWRTDAQDELVRRGSESVPHLIGVLKNESTPGGLETWAVWTLARLGWPGDATLLGTNLNRRLQWLRARPTSDAVVAALKDSEPRLRLASVENAQADHLPALVNLLAGEEDRVVYHAAWRAVLRLGAADGGRQLLSEGRPGVKRAGLLILLELGALRAEEVTPFTKAADKPTAELASLWIAKHKGTPSQAPAPGPPAFALARNIRAESGAKYASGVWRVGAQPYTDRPYVIHKMPAPLEGVSSVMTANDDDGSRGETFLSFEVPVAVTVFVAHDTRNRVRPAWLAGWTDSALDVLVERGTYHVWQRDFPAGRITLGGNTLDGVPGGKGQYFVALRPVPSTPRAQPAKIAETLPLVKGARADRGEVLFFAEGAAGCAKCHQVGSRGHNFGPDLAGAGDRFDAEHILRSMIEPGAVITEGFALRVITMKDGATHSGILLEQSGVTLTLAQIGAPPARLPRAEIATEESVTASPMPPFAQLLAPQDLADLTAFLLAQHTEKPAELANRPAGNAARTAAKAGELSIQEREDRVELSLGGQPLAAYLFRHPEVLRPGWINVRTPGGIQVTRNFPLQPEDQTGADHPTMHPGVWLAFGDVNGHDHWRNKARSEHVAFEHPPRSEGTRGSFTTLNRLLTADGGTEVCRQRTRYAIALQPDGWRLDVDAEFWSDTADFSFGHQDESGLGVRVASALRVSAGGLIKNSLGAQNEKGTWGREAAWWDYSGKIKERHVGILVAPSPKNARPSWGHTRDYGVMVVNPFARNPGPDARDPANRTPVKRGERFRLAYRILFHETAAPLDSAAVARELSKELN